MKTRLQLQWQGILAGLNLVLFPLCGLALMTGLFIHGHREAIRSIRAVHGQHIAKSYNPAFLPVVSVSNHDNRLPGIIPTTALVHDPIAPDFAGTVHPPVKTGMFMADQDLFHDWTSAVIAGILSTIPTVVPMKLAGFAGFIRDLHWI